jgi:cytochrome b561
MNDGEMRRPDESPRYGIVARLLHWVIVAMVLVQIPAGVAMTSEPLAAAADPLFILHKGMGAMLLVLGAGHAAIYVLLLVMTVSGYVRTVGDGFPIELLDALGIPPLLPPMPEVAAIMLVVHQFAVFGVGAVAGHVAMVLRHQLIEGNPAMRRMWPPWER